MGLLIPSVLVQQPKVKENSVYQYDVLTSYHVTGSQWLLSDQAAHLRTLLEISHPLTKPSQNVNCSLQSDFEIASEVTQDIAVIQQKFYRFSRHITIVSEL